MELNMFECIVLGVGINFLLFSGPILLFSWVSDS